MARRRLTSSLSQFYIKQFTGQNTKVEENELNLAVGIKAQNCRFEDQPGSVVKRPPLRYYNATTLGVEPIVGAYRWYKSDGSAGLYAVYDTTLKIGTDSTGAFTNVKTGLTTGKRGTFVTYKDLLLYSNGYEDIVVTDGSTDNVSWELGACKAVAGPDTGITRTAISYKIGITVSGSEHICGASSNVIASVTNKNILLSNIPLGPSGATNRKIYRQSSETTGYRLLTTISNNSATTYTDTTADISAGDAMGAVTDDMPKGNLLQLYRERLFISGDPNYPNRIYYSNPYLPHFIQQTTNLDYLTILENDGDEIMGIPIVMGIMRVIKRNSICNVHINVPISGVDPTLEWYAEDPFTHIGSPAKWSIVQTPYGVIFLGWDHWYRFAGTVPEPIIDEFDAAEDIASNNYNNTVAYWHNDHLLWGYTDAESGTVYHNRCGRYNFKRKALSYDTYNANCFASAVGDDESGELYLGDSNSGLVYKVENKVQNLSLKKKSDVNLGTKDDIYAGGTEEDPWIEIGRTETIDELTGTIDDLTGTIDMPDTTGTYTAPSVEINASTLSKIYWNVDRYDDSDTVYAYTRTGATQVACEAADWSAALTNPNGSTIASTANVWFQWKLEFVANSTAGSPRVYLSDGYLVKFEYVRGGTIAETAVEFVYELGHRNFDSPFVDKIFRKLISIHEGTTGTYTIYWYTDDGTQFGEFVINLEDNPRRWESYFPSTAFGRRINIRLYKNDLNDLKVKELQGAYAPQPIIV